MVCTTRKWKQYIGNIARMLRLKKIPRVHFKQSYFIFLFMSMTLEYLMKKFYNFIRQIDEKRDVLLWKIKK